MFSDEEKQIAVDMALTSKEKLMSAFLIGYSIDKIKNCIIETFVVELKKQLVAELSEEWVFDYTINHTESYGVSFGIQKNSWLSKGWSISVEAGNAGPDNFYFGFAKKTNEEHLPSLKERIDEKLYGYASKHNDYWIWYSYCDNRYRYWPYPRYLANLYFDSNTGTMVLEYFKNQILTIKSVADEYFAQHNI